MSISSRHLFSSAPVKQVFFEVHMESFFVWGDHWWDECNDLLEFISV